MSKLKIIDTVKKSFSLLKKDPTLMVLFILPAIFPTERIISNYLNYLMFSHMLETQELLTVPTIPALIVYSIVGFLFGVWASAGAILKVTELEKGSKLGLMEALYKGLEKVPKLLVPAIVGLSLYILMVVSLTTVAIPYVLVGMPLLAQDVGPSIIVLQVATGFLFTIGLYVATRLRLYAPACVLENNFGLKTSWRLVKGNWWKLFAILLIFGAMSVIISRIPKAGVFLRGLIVEPFSITAITLVYFQLREARSSGEEHKESP